MSLLQNMRVIEMPKFRAVSSGPQTLEELFGPQSRFSAWVDGHRQLLKTHIFEPSDFLWHENRNVDTSVWAVAVRDEVAPADTEPYEIIEFPGGMFLVATCDESNRADMEETVGCMRTWIRNSGAFTYGGFPESGMCNMPNPDGRIDKALGISQQQIFLPLRFVTENT